MAPNNQCESEIKPLSREEIDKRKQWLRFDATDEERIRSIDPLMNSSIDGIMNRLYEHFVSFDETRRFFHDSSVLERAKGAQNAYFRRLTRGNYDSEYTAQRLLIGNTHHRVGLAPKWYLGAYSFVLLDLAELIQEQFQTNPLLGLETLKSLIRVIFFDLGLAIDSYIEAKEDALKRQRTALSRLETEQNAINSVLESSPIGIARLTTGLDVVSANVEFMQMLDCSSYEEVGGKNLRVLAPLFKDEALSQVAESGQPVRKTGELIQLKEGEPAGYYDWAAWPVRQDDGSTSELVVLFVNVTDRVLLQQQREDFVATLTHDLKTPILAANRAVKLLLEGDFGPVSQEQTRILETLHQSNESMYKMVQTLLDVYRYDSGAKQLKMAAADLTQTLSQVVAELRPLAEAKRIELLCDMPEVPRSTVCDLDELRRVIQNLLDNSLKFTPTGGRITIRLVHERGLTQISVQDTGKGIQEEDLPKLFQRFWQASTSGRYYASTGLGLYLCRQIVELHGGKIWCESSPGQGSTFVFTIAESRSAGAPDG